MARLTGKSGKRGARARTVKSRAEIDAQRLGLIEKFLVEQALNKDKTVDSARITAAKAVYDKLRPTLSAVEQTNINESDLVSEDKIVSALQALISQRPELVDMLVTFRDQQSKTPELHQPDVTH